MSNEKTHCGFVTIIGRTNVGKSTLLNKLLGQKISITSRKPQTTRHQIIGIDTKYNYQTIYIDTPGLNIEKNNRINCLINRSVSNSIFDVELIIFVVEGTRWTINDEIVINKLRHLSCPILLAINKIDNLIDKTSLLPYIKFLSKQMNFLYIVPISAKKNNNIDTIIKIIHQHIPESAHHFPANCITDRSQYFMASEIIREKLMRFLGDELPYSVTVKIERFIVNELGFYNIYGLILVKKNNHKKIIIGNKADKIKKISIEARVDMKKFFSTKIYLKLWVKVHGR
ncbi:MAG: GTPase Era [Arsenophonus sp. ET-DL9-MAG3]